MISFFPTEQDEGFDTLIGVVRRQKEMAKDIGNEVEYQNGKFALFPVYSSCLG